METISTSIQQFNWYKFNYRNCCFNFWSDETKIGLIPETLQNKTCSLTFCLGVSGNVLIILTVMRKSSFKSPTNTFLASLATADLLLITVCLPVKVSTSETYSSAALTAQKLVWIPLTCQKYNLHIKEQLPRQCSARPAPTRPLSQCYACWTTDGLMFWKQVGKWGSIELIIPLPNWMKFFIPFVSNFGVKWSHYLTIIVFIFQLFRLFTFTWPFGSLVCKLTFYIQVLITCLLLDLIISK